MSSPSSFETKNKFNSTAENIDVDDDGRITGLF